MSSHLFEISFFKVLVDKSCFVYKRFLDAQLSDTSRERERRKIENEQRERKRGKEDKNEEREK